MPYPDQLLADDEKVVKHLHPHWITLVVPVLVFVVTAGLASFLVTVVPAGSPQQPLRLGILGVALLVLLVLVLVPLLRWRTTHYVLTSHRLMVRTGILNHRGKDIPLNRINNAMYEQSIWDRILNAGTLVVESAGEDGQQVFVNIPNADRTQQLINRLVEQDSDRRSRDSARYEAEAEHGFERRDPSDTAVLRRDDYDRYER